MKIRTTALAILFVLVVAPAVLEAKPIRNGVTCVCSNGDYIHADRCGDCDLVCSPGFPIQCQIGPRMFPKEAVPSVADATPPVEATESQPLIESPTLEGDDLVAPCLDPAEEDEAE